MAANPKPADPAPPPAPSLDPAALAAQNASLQAELDAIKAALANGGKPVIPPAPPHDGPPLALFQQLASVKLKGSARGALDGDRISRDPDGIDLLGQAGERLPAPQGPLALAVAHAANTGTAGVAASAAVAALDASGCDALLAAATTGKVQPERAAAWLRARFPEPRPPSIFAQT